MTNKKTAPKKSKISQHKTEIRSVFSRIVGGFFAWFSVVLQHFKKSITKVLSWFRRLPSQLKLFPGWLKSQPNAFKRWLKEDRKKKKYRSFRLQKRLKPEPRYVPSAWLLIKESLSFIWVHKKIFVSMILIQAILYVTLLKAPQSPLNVTEIRDSVSDALGPGSENSLPSTFATLGTVLGLSGNTQSGGTVAAITIFMASLIYIWAIRQLHNKHVIKVRDAYYQGLSPIIPVIILLVVLSIQIIPFAATSFVYTIARTGGLFVNGVEDFAFFSVTVCMGLLSFYLLTPTVIAMYIATLPGMYPFRALRSAKKLVQFQRFMVFRRVVALPVILGVSYLLILLLLIRFLPGQVFIFAEGYQILILPLIHVYLYKLYRALI